MKDFNDKYVDEAQICGAVKKCPGVDVRERSVRVP